MRVSIRLIEPLKCARPRDVTRYVAMLIAGKIPPAILLIRQRRGSRYRYRVFDGAHRLRAAKRTGQKTIAARVIATE
jgi:uncharacterized ParB-like nuclease family protein